MADPRQLAREWVEVGEESEGKRIVLRPSSYSIPPSRGGRRHLELGPSGQGRALGLGATDRLEAKGSGGWSLEGDTLQLELTGWEGTYDIEQLGDEILVLRRR
jgi:hypothetical protein